MPEEEDSSLSLEVLVGRLHSSGFRVEERRDVEVSMGADGRFFELPRAEAEGRRYPWKGWAEVSFAHWGASADGADCALSEVAMRN